MKSEELQLRRNFSFFTLLLFNADFVNSQFDFSARNGYFHLIACLMVEQTLCYGGGYCYLAFAQVCLAFAYDGVSHFRFVGKVGHLHFRENLYGVGAQTRRVDDFSL